MQNRLFKTFEAVGLIFLLGVSMSAEAGLFGIGEDKWKEEVLLHDGSKLIVNRSQSYGGEHEIGQPSPVKEHTIIFSLPGSKKTIKWVSEYGEDIGRTNFNLLAIHVLNGTPYIVASPNLCLSYNKWGRPNPPYVFFKYDGQEWKRISLEELPSEFNTINLIVNTSRKKNIKEEAGHLGYVPEKGVQHINSSLTQPEFRTILREPLTEERIDQKCEKRVLYNGSWILPDDSTAKKFIDQQGK